MPTLKRSNVIPFAEVVPKNKPFSLDITQVHEHCGMMSIDACLPTGAVVHLLKYLETHYQK